MRVLAYVISISHMAFWLQTYSEPYLESNKRIRAHIPRGRSTDQQTPSWIESCPTMSDSSFQTHHYAVVFQEESTERESHSPQDMSKTHWKDIHLLDQIEEF